MKNYLTISLVLLFTTIAFPGLGATQDIPPKTFEFAVNRIYPPLSISKEKLAEAQSIIDLNKHYKSNWIRTYRSVEITTIYQGSEKIATGENDILTQQQKEIMRMADLGSDISVVVRYIPENNLKHNDIKEIKFSFSVDPEHDAEYPGGAEALNTYLEKKAMNKIADNVFHGYKLAAVKFSINEKGEVINPHIFESARDENTDALLLQVLSDMPNWKPASYSNGHKVTQDFVLSVGNMESCVRNLLNMRKD